VELKVGSYQQIGGSQSIGEPAFPPPSSTAPENLMAVAL
jgi:hypothetical protein